MNGFTDWLKKDKRYLLIGKMLLMALLPVLCCIVTCASQGKTIGDVYLPASEWNDELFYYKQVESIIEFGYPQGYYGFNESRALKLSFAAWSPVLVLPWIVWGLLFGWNLLSPVICNIVLLTVAAVLFVWLTKPTWKQMGVLALLFCLYTPFVRYMLSGMPEIICFSHLIVFYGLAVNYQREEKVWKLALLFVLSGLLTLMRPYMLLFMVLPAYFLIAGSRKKKKMWRGVVVAAVVFGVVLLTYALIKHYLGAEYFHPLFFTDWITVFFTDGIGAGMHHFFGTLYWKGKDFSAYILQAVRSGLASGAYFAGYLVTLAILLWQSFSDGKKLRRKKGAAAKDTEKDTERRVMFVTEAHMAFSFVGMLFALLLMYKLTEGSKHLLTFMAAAIFIVSLMETRFYKKTALLGAVFVFFYSYMAVDPYDYQVPFAEQGLAAQYAEWQDDFAEKIKLSGEKAPNYDNVVIWVFNEQNPESGETMKWQLLYALPEGFGISCCQKEYVLKHFDALNSRYIVAQTGAEVDRKCRDGGCTELARDKDIVLYKR